MVTLLSENKNFGGVHRRYGHRSSVLDCHMVFAVYLPPQALAGHRVPVLYWLSGLTCTDENFMQKAGAQRIAAELGIAIVAPDTSPRGEGVPTDIEGGWDLGFGAGFYVNATQEPWAKHYRMHDYVVLELPSLIEASMPVNNRRGISGHSMGGHGALICSLRNPGRYRSVSAFSPICHPTESPWGIKAFTHYLGPDRALWAEWDTCALLAAGRQYLPLLIDQGTADNFISTQLMPEQLVRAAADVGCPLTLRRQPGYDHSYYFIATFIEEHLRHHARALLA